MTLRYHAGQLEVQAEANTRPVADMLADWVGPVGLFCESADMIVLATEASAGHLEFTALSGAAPVVEPAGPNAVLLRIDGDRRPAVDARVSCGGLAIGFAVARRARLNGTLEPSADGLLLRASEAFTNCRKYVVPSVALEASRHFGPLTREEVSLADTRVAELLGRAETSFIATVSPDGVVDCSHRGGPAGFLRADAAAGRLTWDEYVGDGMLKSAGNVRATGIVSLLVPDFDTGDTVELAGRARVEVFRRDQRARTDGLVQHREDFPIQGAMVFDVERVARLAAFTHPRQRLEKRQRVTSASSTREQAPQ